jgi:hypothetical protein
MKEETERTTREQNWKDCPDTSTCVQTHNTIITAVTTVSCLEMTCFQHSRHERLSLQKRGKRKDAGSTNFQTINMTRTKTKVTTHAPTWSSIAHSIGPAASKPPSARSPHHNFHTGKSVQTAAASTATCTPRTSSLIYHSQTLVHGHEPAARTNKLTHLPSSPNFVISSHHNTKIPKPFNLLKTTRISQHAKTP